MDTCPKCGSEDIGPKWCEYCFNTEVDSMTGNECTHCEPYTMVCNDCYNTWEI